MTAGRVRASSGSPADRAQAEQNLQQALAEADTTGFLNYGLRARLVMGQIEMNSGQSDVGRARLEALQRDAAGKGFALIAQEAATTLRTAGTNGR